MQEAYVEVGRLLSEVKTRVISGPCPFCGGGQDQSMRLGEVVKCKNCKEFYTVEDSLNKTSEEALRNLVENAINDATGRVSATTDARLRELANLLQDYTRQVFDKTRDFYDTMRRLPLREELDKRLSERDQQILETIASYSEKLLDGQKGICVRLDSVTGKVDSIQISMTEIKKLLELVVKTYGTDWHRMMPKVEVVLSYFDKQNQRRNLKVHNVVIGRSEKGFELEARFPDGSIQLLGLMDLTVSRKHVRIVAEEGIATAMDLESKNGTYLNGRKIEPKMSVKLHDGDEIQIGLNTKCKIKFVELGTRESGSYYARTETLKLKGKREEEITEEDLNEYKFM